MNENWNEILRDEPVDLTPRAGFEAQLRDGLVAEWNGRPMVIPDVADRSRLAATGSPRRGWLLGVAAAAVLVVGGLVVATRGGGTDTVVSPATAPTNPASTPPSAVPTSQSPVVPTVTTELRVTIPPPSTRDVTAGAIVVPVDPVEVVPVEPFAVVANGTGPGQIQMLNGEFPPPVAHGNAGYLVFEDAPQTGLTGRAVLVPREQSEVRVEREVTGLEPGGTPWVVRSFDGGGIVIVTVHDASPLVRVRRYVENPSGVFAPIGPGADYETLDSSLRITADGAMWNGDVAIESDPSVARPTVLIDPSIRLSSDSTVSRPLDEGDALAWRLDIEFDPDFPPGTNAPLVEPFGEGALMVVANSNNPGGSPTLVLLGADGSGDVYDLDGWRVDDVNPDEAVLSRNTAEGIELAVLEPGSGLVESSTPEPATTIPSPTTLAPAPVPVLLENWPAPSAEPGNLDSVARLLPTVEIEGVTDVFRFEFESAPIDRYDYTQAWITDDGLGYVEITTNLAQFDSTPLDFRTPVEIDGWDDAYFARSTPEFANLRLVSADGVAWVSQQGLGRDRIIEIAKSMTRRPIDQPGWNIDEFGLTAFNEGGDIASASRTVRFERDQSLIAELTISEQSLNGAPVNWSPASTIEVLDIGGRTAVATDNGFATAVSWSLADGTGMLFGFRGSIDQAVEIARSLAPVDQAGWEAQTRVDPNPQDGCTSLFC